jgi:hypothetical protein
VPIERDSFGHHRVRFVSRALATLLVIVGLSIGGFVVYKYREVSTTNTKPVDNSESRAELDKLYGGADSPQTEISQLVTVKSEYTKLTYTLPNGWIKSGVVDKKLGTETLAAASQSGTSKISITLGYPQIGGGCSDTTPKDIEVVDVERLSAENTSAVDESVRYVAAIYAPASESRVYVSAGLQPDLATNPLKVGDKLACPGVQYYLLTTKYLSPRDIITLGEYFAVSAGTDLTMSKGVVFDSVNAARDYIAGEEYQQLKQLLTSVTLNQ